MSQRPLVSIITPAYNREGLIAETIESVISQEYENLEYIVLDDGSTDATLEVIKRYEGRLRYESHPNMGEAGTVNRGFSLASGEFVGVVNSDDPLLPGAIEELVKCLLQYPEVVVVYPDYYIIDQNGKTLRANRCREFVSHQDMVRGHHCLPGPAALIRRTVIDSIGGRDPFFRFTGDIEFWLRAGFHGDFKRVPILLATFRVHSESISIACQNRGMAEEHIQLIERFYRKNHLNQSWGKYYKESFINAYHAVACTCGRGNRIFKIKSICNSVLVDPLVFLKKYYYRIFIYFLIVFGFEYSQVVGFFKRFLKDEFR